MKKLSDEALVNMICGIDCGDNPYVTIEDVRREILLRFEKKEVNNERCNVD